MSLRYLLRAQKHPVVEEEQEEEAGGGGGGGGGRGRKGFIV